MKIIILGATGFIGRNMVEKFSATHDVTAVDHIKPRFEIDGVKWLCADLRQPLDLRGYDVVVQAAATTSGSKDIVNNPAIHVTDNAIMNSLIFKAAHEAGVKHVIFFSCTVMYQSREYPITESDFSADDPLHPRYFGVGNTKLYCEKLCEFYSRIGETKFTAIRHSNCYGQYDKYDLERSHVFGATVAKVMNAKNEVTIWGTGEESRDLLHVDDLCDFVECALSKQENAFEIYNCGAGIAVEIRSLVQKIIDASGKKLNIEHDLSAPTIPTSLCLDCAKAKNELGWQPKITLDEGINKTLKWYKNEFLQ